MFNQLELNQLYRYAWSLCKQDDMAYDLLQTAMQRYLERRDMAVEKPMAYLKTIIRNVYLDIQRHYKVVSLVISEQQDNLDVVAEDDTLDEILINQQQAEQVINMLSDDENELLYLWAVEEYTVDEIAGMYNSPRGTVLSKLHRLKKRIREYFTQTESVQVLEHE